MSRLQAPDRAALSAEAQAIWDRIAATRSGGQMRGPSSIMMNVPELASRVMVQRSGSQRRRCSALPNLSISPATMLWTER